MAFNLSDSGRYRISIAVFMEISCLPCMLVVDVDRIAVMGKFLDDPAVLRASGLDFIEVIRLADKPEIRGSEKCAFLCSEHYPPSFHCPSYDRHNVFFCFSISISLLDFW